MTQGLARNEAIASERELQRENSSTSKNVLKLEVVYMVTTDLTVLLKSSFSDKTTSAA